MIDPSVLSSVMPDKALSGLPNQTLPPPQSHDVMRFDDVMSGKLDVSTINAQSNNQSVLQIGELGSTADPTSFKDVVINKLSKLDGSYSSIMDQLNNRKGFQDYLGEVGGIGGGGQDALRSYPPVSSTTQSGSMDDHYKSLAKNIEDTQIAAMNYQRDTTSWSLNAEMWATTVNLVSSAVNQVSQGFKTLFRASG